MLSIAGIVVLVSTNPAESAAAKRALLIGINRYAADGIPTLGGCLNDVRAMEYLLESRYGFPADQVQILLDQRATRDAILGALREIVARALADDEVYIHFSGHGSQVRDLDGDERDDELDETIVPYDGRTPGVPDITDDELNGILSGLQTTKVLIVLDACHSGTATRSIAIRTRSIPLDGRTSLYGVKTRGAAESPPARERSQDRYVLMTATGPRESALDGPIQGATRGLFSFALSKVMAVASVAAPPLRLLNSVKEVLLTVQEEVGALKLPQPQLEAPADLLELPIFAGRVGTGGEVGEAIAPPLAGPATASGFPEETSPSTVQPSATTSVEVVSETPGQVRLVKAALLGAMPGSYWAIYPPGNASFQVSGASATAEVISIAGEDAEAIVNPPGHIPQGGSRAIPVTSAPSPQAVSLELRAPEPIASQLRLVL